MGKIVIIKGTDSHGDHDLTIFHRLHSIPWHPNLVRVFDWVYWQLANRKATIRLTSGWRPLEQISGESGIHATEPLRAVDFTVVYFHKEETKALCIIGNRMWEYDSSRPGKYKVFIPHEYKTKTGQLLGYHIHMQVHDNTKRKAPLGGNPGGLN